MTWRTLILGIAVAAAAAADVEPVPQQVAVLSAAGNIGALHSASDEVASPSLPHARSDTWRTDLELREPRPTDAVASPATLHMISDARRADLAELWDSLPSDMKLMRTALDGALNVNGSLEVDARVGSLLVLQELVEDVDNARDLMGAGGFLTVLSLLQSDEVALQANVLWVLGTAAQNSPELQRHLCTEVNAPHN